MRNTFQRRDGSGDGQRVGVGQKQDPREEIALLNENGRRDFTHGHGENSEEGVDHVTGGGFGLR